MKKLSEISESIRSKRNESLDEQNFLISALRLSPYDIRKTRNTEKMKEDLLRDGQLQPLTVSKNGNVYTIVNGRTRYLGMTALPEHFATAAIEVYEDLTVLEQNYLNAQINVGQNPLLPDEKRDFIIKHRHELPMEDMAKALGLGMEMFKNYEATTKVTAKVLEAWTPKSEGHGRGSVKVEELGKVIRKFEQMGVKPNMNTLKKLGKESEKSELKRDEKRIQFPKVVEKTASLMKNTALVKKYDVDTIIKSAAKEVLNSNSNGTSGDKLPQNSSEKYKITTTLLKTKYDFAVLLFAEGLYRIDDEGNSVESETKRIIDGVDEVIVVGNELEKLSEIEDYALSVGKTITLHNEDVLDACENDLETDDRKGLIYVNGASFFAQRPEFMNYLKKKYPKSVVAMVVLDLFFGRSQAYAKAILKERLTVYAGAETFDEVIAQFRSRVKFVKIRKYSEAPQEKYIIYS